ERGFAPTSARSGRIAGQVIDRLRTNLGARRRRHFGQQSGDGHGLRAGDRYRRSESPSRNRRRRIDQGEGAFQSPQAAPAVGHGYRLIGFTPRNPSAVLALQSIEPG